MTLMKDNLLNFQKIGRNLKFDHRKVLKNGDKVSHVLEPKCDFWDICDILDPLAWRFVVTNSYFELGAWHWDQIWDSTNFLLALGAEYRRKTVKTPILGYF